MKLVIAYLKYGISTWFGLLTEHKYCPKWDQELSRLLDTHEPSGRFNSLDGALYTIKLGDSKVWVENRWYSSGHLRGKDGKSIPYCKMKRPSVKTMARLYEIADALEKKLQDED